MKKQICTKGRIFLIKDQNKNNITANTETFILERYSRMKKS